MSTNARPRGLLKYTAENLSRIPESRMRFEDGRVSTDIVVRGSHVKASPFRILHRNSNSIQVPPQGGLDKEFLFRELISGSSKHLVFYDHGMRAFFRVPVAGTFHGPMFILKKVPAVIADGYFVFGMTDHTKRVFKVTKKDLLRKRIGNAREVTKDDIFSDPLVRGVLRNGAPVTDATPGADSGETTGEDLHGVEGSVEMGEADPYLGIQEQIESLSRV